MKKATADPTSAADATERRTSLYDEIDDDGLPHYAADPERCARVAGVAVNHAVLRRIPNAQKKLALVLSAYPTKHSRVGNAVGLDTPVSAVRLLRRLSDEGYDVGDGFGVLDIADETAAGDRLIHTLIEAGGQDEDWLSAAQLTGAQVRVTAEQYGRFLCEIFDIWWPERRKMRIRFFDNLAEALAGQKPGACTMHETCDSYVVVEYNGDIFPCDFFVESVWKLGNINVDSWPEIARRRKRYEFAANKTIPHPLCQACEYRAICHAGCPKFRHARHRRFDDLDYFCPAYKMIYAKAMEPLRREVEKLLARAPGAQSPY